MPSTASSSKALFGAVSRCSFKPSPTSLRAPPRAQQFSSHRSNWMPQVSSAQRITPWRPSHTQSMPTVSSSASRTAFIRSRRNFSSTPVTQHNHLTPPKPGEERSITFIDRHGDSHTFQVADGDNLLDIALENDIEMEGACGGSCACSTCHVIVESDHYDAMKEPDDEENDMLDLAFGLTETSRLGCQVEMSKELDGLVVKLPTMTRNMQASDFANK